jgi:hypothetical protein
VFKKINIFESTITMNDKDMTVKQLLEQASVEQIRAWANEIKADEKRAINTNSNLEHDLKHTKQDLQIAYDKWRKSEDDKVVLRMLTLAGIQKHVNMTDLEFLERGRKAIDDARRIRKIRGYKGNG